MILSLAFMFLFQKPAHSDLSETDKQPKKDVNLHEKTHCPIHYTPNIHHLKNEKEVDKNCDYSHEIEDSSTHFHPSFRFVSLVLRVSGGFF